uniref:Chitin-binding type-2 domain-containing protein n=1 Tax=Anopheles culicifacies TaxID=139723 RepID=A0A182MNS4_9DIPT
MRHEYFSLRRVTQPFISGTAYRLVVVLIMASFLIGSKAQQAVPNNSANKRISCYNASTVPDYLCPPDVARLRLEHETACNRYYVCENGKATEMSCPGRRFYNRHTQTCGQSTRPCRTNARVLIQHVPECRLKVRSSTNTAGTVRRDVCWRVFVPYPSVSNATGVLVCNADGSGFLAQCPVTFTGIQTMFVNGKCRVRQVMRGRHKWEQLLRNPGRYPPDTVSINRMGRTGIRPLDTAEFDLKMKGSVLS